MDKEIKNCYIHIPFCNKICSYCDFCKVYYNSEMVNKYLNALELEIKSIYKGESLNTIYIGGGTPSSLSLDELDKLFDIIKIFKLDDNYEFTVECNFDSIDENKLSLFKKNGVNRLSFGIESTIDKNLKVLDRDFSKKKIIDTIKLCRSLGFDNINVDLMYAIPGEDINDLEEDIEFILNLDVEHISTYSLIIEEHTKLFINNTNYIDEDMDSLMYKLICNKLSKNYKHYEISNFCKEGVYSRHNLCYWKNKNYYGFGVGASSYIDDKRINNTRSITKYLKNDYLKDYEKITISDRMSYEMILGLRLIKGINKRDFKNKYGIDINMAFDIDDLFENSLLIDDGEYIYIPEDKLYISNEILVYFIKE